MLCRCRRRSTSSLVAAGDSALPLPATFYVAFGSGWYISFSNFSVHCCLYNVQYRVVLVVFDKEEAGIAKPWVVYTC